MKKLIGACLLAAASVFLAGCPSNSDDSPPPPGGTTPPPGGTNPPPANQAVTLGNAALGVFVVTNGGSSSTFLGYDSGGNGLTVDSSRYHFSMIIPSTSQWVVLDSHTSVSYAASSILPFVQDDRVFQVTDYGGFNDVGSVYFAELNLQTNSFGSQHQVGTDVPVPNHVAMVGNQVFFRQRTVSDLFGTTGGQLKVNANWQAGQTPTTLLARTDADNQATFDVGDGGTVYAIRHNTAAHTLTVHTRSLTTGRLATTLRDLLLVDQPLYQPYWSMKVNKGILYIVRKRLSDNLFEVLSTDLRIVNTSLHPTLLTSYTTAEGGFIVNDNVWGVDDGRLAFAVTAPGSNRRNKLAVYDSGAKASYDLGADIYNVAVLYRN
jgi:hypothetical protein